jgi:translation initiation factor 4B
LPIAKDRQDRGEPRELNDWTRKGPLPDLPQTRRASDRGGGREAPEMERGGSRRGAPAFDGDGKVRDFNNWERKGPLSAIPGAEPMRGNGRVRTHDGPRERKNSPSWGEGRSQDGSRPPRGEFRDRPQAERQPTAAELDTEWRARMKPDASDKTKTPTPEASTPSSPKQAPAPAVRPKLNLQKRTVSEQVEPSSAATPSDSKSSPFGAARPIDTATREREVEEKRQLVLRQKRESDEKAREEKRAKDTDAKGATSVDDEDGSAEEDNKEDDADAPNPNKNYQILSRTADEDNEDKDDEEPQEARKESKPNGVSNDPKPKSRGPPREHREPPRGPKNQGSWRHKKQSAPSSPAIASSDNHEEDGWSTVGPTKGRGQRSRGGRTGGS